MLKHRCSYVFDELKCLFEDENLGCLWMSARAEDKDRAVCGHRRPRRSATEPREEFTPPSSEDAMQCAADAVHAGDKVAENTPTSSSTEAAKYVERSGLKIQPFALPLGTNTHHYMTAWARTINGERQVFMGVTPPVNQDRLNLADWKRLNDPYFRGELHAIRQYLRRVQDDPVGFNTGLDLKARNPLAAVEIIELRPDVLHTHREEIVVERDISGEIYLRVYPPILSEAQADALFSDAKQEEINETIQRLKAWETPKTPKEA